MELLRRILQAIVDWAIRHPTEALILAAVIFRLFATTVQSGWVGVLFRFGRARRAIEPGFRWLIPGIETVRKIHSRAITQELPLQRIATADGLVYDVSASLVYRVRDPVAAMIEIDDLAAGCETAGALGVYEALRDRTREELRDRERLDDEFTRIARRRLGPWGLDVDRAGFTTIAPTRRTLRVTQLRSLVLERAAALKGLEGDGLSRTESLFLLGADRVLCSHAHARYRERARRGRATVAERRLAARLSQEEAAAVEEEIDALVGEDFVETSAAEEDLAGRGRVIVPRLRERLRRVGDPRVRLRVEALIRKIEEIEAAQERPAEER